MISADAAQDNVFNEIRPLKKGFIYYDPVDDRILHLTPECHVYFKYDMLWKVYSDRKEKRRRIRSLLEAKEIMNQSGYVYLSEL